MFFDACLIWSDWADPLDIGFSANGPLSSENLQTEELWLEKQIVRGECIKDTWQACHAGLTTR